MNRLDRANFGGPLQQALLYKALRNPKTAWPEYEVGPDEEYDLYKISYRAYGTTEAWWVISVCAKLDDPLDKVEAGTTFQIPTLSWLRSKLMEPGKTITN